MKSRLITALAAGAAIALIPSAALAQRQPPTPEQRLDRLERQVQEMQRQVFPKGRPADTAGLADDPAATQSSVMSLDQRLDALERQTADIVRQSEENGNRLRTLEANVGKIQSDEEQRISALEQKMSEAAAAASATAPGSLPAAAPGEAPASKPKTAPAPKAKAASGKKLAKAAAAPPAADEPASAAEAGADPGEDAYSEGFREWQSGQYDQAIATLKAFTAAYPKHHRVSYARNLIGRALLDKGDAHAAAAALLANYRSNPAGERAQDSLFYLGQALIKLGQPSQACKAYGELDAVYGAKVRPDLKKLEADAKTEAQCK